MESTTISSPSPPDTSGLGDPRVAWRVMFAATWGATLFMITIAAMCLSAIDGSISASELALLLVFIGLPTLVTAVGASWVCLRRDRGDEASAACVASGLVGGPVALLLCVGLAFTVASSSNGLSRDWADLITGVIAVVGLAVIVGSPAGMIFSLFFIPLVQFGAHRPRAWDRVDRADLVTGFWMTAIAALVAGLSLLAAEGSRSGAALLGLTVAGVLSGLVGAVVGVRGLARTRARRRWLAEVRAGRLPDWSVRGISNDERPLIDVLPPLFHASNPSKPEELLLRCAESAENGAYRRAERLLPVATI